MDQIKSGNRRTGELKANEPCTRFVLEKFDNHGWKSVSWQRFLRGPT